ncbi:hypothetical protein INT43_000169 [Umbelopsis isabellina]|uniref:RING-type E3 ubiquitin transferase n=1 Tax=Mortierella isabellina TaxID=91625 RepID=A0A8H7PFQ0_MORIS|nr:hypothetical protein INT43_000169 [Umbelopsis isabellina]
MHSDNSTIANTTLAHEQNTFSNDTITDDSISSSLFSARTFLLDCFEGQIITCVVVVVFVAAFLLREWIVQNTPAEAVAGLDAEDPQVEDNFGQEMAAENNGIFEHIVFQPQQDQNNALQPPNARRAPEPHMPEHQNRDVHRLQTLLNPQDSHLDRDRAEELQRHLREAVEMDRAWTDESNLRASSSSNFAPYSPLFNQNNSSQDEQNDTTDNSINSNDYRSVHSEGTSYSANVLNQMDIQKWGRSSTSASSPNSNGKAAMFDRDRNQENASGQASTSNDMPSFNRSDSSSSLNKRHDMMMNSGGEESSKSTWKSKERTWPGQLDNTHSPSIGSPAPNYLSAANGSVAVDEQSISSSSSSQNLYELAQTNLPTQAPPAPRMPYLQAPPAPDQVNRPVQMQREAPERPNVAFGGRQNIFNERNENNAQFFDNVNAAADDDDEEDGDVGDDLDGVLEAVGMRGSLWLLAQNSILMCLLISLCLGAAVWVPYVVGKLFILIKPLQLIQLPISALRIFIDPLVDFILDFCLPKALDSLKSFANRELPGLMNHPTLLNVMNGCQDIKHHISTIFQSSANTEKRSKTFMDYIDISKKDAVSESTDFYDSIQNFVRHDLEPFFKAAMKRWHYFAIGRTVMDRIVCVAIGYMILVLLGAWYLRKTGNAYGRTVGRTVQQAIRQQGIILKVAFFISIELVLFPIVCGVLLDISTLPMFATATFASRWEFYQNHPITTIFIHWFLGTGFMFHFAVFVTLCRDIVRPGVMWFIRDPNDPQFHPIKEILERPVLTQLRKIGASGIMYSAMIFFGIGTVIFIIAVVGGSVLPLRWSYTEPLSYFPIDLLVIHLIIPPTITLIKPKILLEHAFSRWWHSAAKFLRLSSFMFDERHADEEGTHFRKTWNAWIHQRKAPVVSIDEADVSIQHVSEDGEVEFVRDGQLVRAPRLDGVPVIPGRRMLVPVDPHTLEPLDSEERRLGHPAATAAGGNDANTVIVYLPPHFRRRVILFLFLMWFCGSVFLCSVTIIPLLLGRHIFDNYITTDRKVHDIYSFALGLYLMWFFAVAFDWTAKHKQRLADNGWHMHGTDIKQVATKYGSVALKVGYLFTTIGLILPLLVGLCMELYILNPFRDLDNKPPTIDPLQDWAFGIVLLNILHGVINVLPENHLQQLLTQVFGAGITRTNIMMATKSIIGPLMLGSVLAILLPSLIIYGSIQTLGMYVSLNDTAMQLFFFQSIYPATLFVLGCIYLCKLAIRLARHIMQSIRDDTYLIGRRLHNVDGSIEQE